MVLYNVGTLSATVAANVEVLIGGWSIVRGLGLVLVIPAGVGLLLADYEGAQRGPRWRPEGLRYIWPGRQARATPAPDSSPRSE